MARASSSWWLRAADGSRVPIGSGGVLIGRAPDCDVVLTDERASRRHALVHTAGSTPRLVPLGRGRTAVDGADADAERVLREGQRIGVPGLELTLESATEPARAVAEWVLQRVGGGLYGVSSTPFHVGGGSGDDLCIEGWPEGALTFRRIAGQVSLEAHTAVTLDSRELPVGSIEPCRSGAEITFAGQTLRVVVASELGGMRTTAEDEEAPPALPHRVRLSFLPRGARLFVTDPGGERAVYLPERRAELVSLLLRPPSPHEPGDEIPDELVLARLWPRQAKTTNDIHVLVHRVRKSLVGAGIDGCELIVRTPRAGSTRFAVAPGAEISVV